MTQPESGMEPLPDRFSTDYPVIVTAEPSGSAAASETEESA